MTYFQFSFGWWQKHTDSVSQRVRDLLGIDRAKRAGFERKWRRDHRAVRRKTELGRGDQAHTQHQHSNLHVRQRRRVLVHLTRWHVPCAQTRRRAHSREFSGHPRQEQHKAHCFTAHASLRQRGHTACLSRLNESIRARHCSPRVASLCLLRDQRGHSPTHILLLKYLFLCSSNLFIRSRSRSI